MNGLGMWSTFLQDSVSALLGYLERLAEAAERIAEASEDALDNNSEEREEP
jgi:hypothetical protein